VIRARICVPIAFLLSTASPIRQPRLVVAAKAAGVAQRMPGAVNALFVNDGCFSVYFSVYCFEHSVGLHLRSPGIPAPASSARFWKSPILLRPKSNTILDYATRFGQMRVGWSHYVRGPK